MRVKCHFINRFACAATAALAVFLIALPIASQAGEYCPTPTRGKSTDSAQNAAMSHITADGMQIVTQQLAHYTKNFPELTFVWLRGEEDLPRVQELSLALGEGADDEVYEHSAAARETLLEAEFGRIAQLIQMNSPSSTLFRTGKHSEYKTPHVCVITLDDRQFLSDRLAASRFFLGTEQVPKDLIVSPVTTLRFTLDHEVFHCLDAYMNGPMYPKTRSRAHAQYSQLQAEMRADFFASVMLRKNHNDTKFVRTLAKVRTLGLLYWDLAHFTRPALSVALQEPLDDLKHDDMRSMAQMARRVVHQLQPSYAHFEHWRASIYWAAVSSGSLAAENDPFAGDMQHINIFPKTLALVDTQLSQITQEINTQQLLGDDVIKADNTFIAQRP